MADLPSVPQSFLIFAGRRVEFRHGQEVSVTLDKAPLLSEP